MKFAPFDTYGMDDDQVLLLKETCEMLSRKFKTEFVNISQRKELLPVFKNIKENIAGIVLVENHFKSCILVFTKVMFQNSRLFMPNPELRHNSFQVSAFSQLRKNFGIIHIRKKTIADKILDIFLCVSINFKHHKRFNKIYHVISDDKDRAILNIDSEVTELLLNIKKEKFHINITRNKLSVEYPHTLIPESIIKLAEFACAMSVV